MVHRVNGDLNERCQCEPERFDSPFCNASLTLVDNKLRWHTYQYYPLYRSVEYLLYADIAVPVIDKKKKRRDEFNPPGHEVMAPRAPLFVHHRPWRAFLA